MKNQNYNIQDLLLLIKYPLVTEKSVNLYEKNCYTFLVDKLLTKNQIKEIFEKLFSIKVIKLNTNILPKKKRKTGQKYGFRPQYKKILIKIPFDQKIPTIFE